MLLIVFACMFSLMLCQRANLVIIVLDDIAPSTLFDFVHLCSIVQKDSRIEGGVEF